VPELSTATQDRPTPGTGPILLTVAGLVAAFGVHRAFLSSRPRLRWERYEWVAFPTRRVASVIPAYRSHGLLGGWGRSPVAAE
jgi:hypothetical protein